MIKIKDLKNRVYGKDMKCTSFLVEVPLDDEDETIIPFRYSKVGEITWNVIALYPKTLISCTQVYESEFQLPNKIAEKLDYVAVVGLKIIQMAIKDEMAKKSNMDLFISELTKGVVS